VTNLDMAYELSSLVKLDIDAAHAYSQAIAAIETIAVRDRLIQFQRDHERHARQLSSVIRALDVEPPEYSQDFKGFSVEGFTAIRSTLGTDGALMAMKTHEELSNKKYREAHALGFTPNIKELIGRNYLDEQVHLKFIEELLADRPWEKNR
jgi:rubrerythrin